MTDVQPLLQWIGLDRDRRARVGLSGGWYYNVLTGEECEITFPNRWLGNLIVRALRNLARNEAGRGAKPSAR